MGEGEGVWQKGALLPISEISKRCHLTTARKGGKRLYSQCMSMQNHPRNQGRPVGKQKKQYLCDLLLLFFFCMDCPIRHPQKSDMFYMF